MIESHTGYRVQLAVKDNLPRFEIIKKHAVTIEESHTRVPAALGRAGNCIHLAYGLATNRLEDVQSKVKVRNHSNKTAASNEGKSYKEPQKNLGFHLAPTQDPPWKEGEDLLHGEENGRPHCKGLRVASDGTRKNLSGSEIWTTTTDMLQYQWSAYIYIYVYIYIYIYCCGLGPVWSPMSSFRRRVFFLSKEINHTHVLKPSTRMSALCFTSLITPRLRICQSIACLSCVRERVPAHVARRRRKSTRRLALFSTRS